MTYPDHMEDESLVELLKEGDHKAFELLFRKYYRPICAYASRFVDSTEVEDIADDCMVWIWEKRASLDIRQTSQGELQLDMNQIKTIDETVLRLAS